jgi:excisionase family DNA binding protein
MMSELAVTEPLTVTLQEARRLTGLGSTTLYRLIREGKLQTLKVGTRTLIVYSSIKLLIEDAVPLAGGDAPIKTNALKTTSFPARAGK